MKETISSQRGTVLLELCVSLPVILILFLFVSQIGLAFNEWNVISFAAREGARYGAITQNEAHAISRSESLIKSNKGINQNTPLNSKYSITAKNQNNNMTVTVHWQGRGLSVKSTKSFRLSK